MLCVSSEKFIFTFTEEYTTLGCWKEGTPRAVPTLEGSSPLLDGSYVSRKNAITKCLESARALGYTVFVIQNGGWCGSSATAMSTYKKYGTSTGCPSSGIGSYAVNNVYQIAAGTCSSIPNVGINHEFIS